MNDCLGSSQEMIREILSIVYLLYTVHAFFDYELYHNLTEDRYDGSYKKAQINVLAAHGFGRVLTWNVKKLGACLRQDNVDQLKEVVCVILQSANLVALQEAENLDLSCLPCSTALKDEYEWPGDSANDEFRVFVKTRHSRSFSIKKYGVCDIGTDEPGKKSHFDDREDIYQTVMREYQRRAEKKQHTEREHSAFNKESTKQESVAAHAEPNNYPTDDEEGHEGEEQTKTKNKHDSRNLGKPEIKKTPGGVFAAQKIRKITEYDNKDNDRLNDGSSDDGDKSTLKYDDLDNLSNRDKQENKQSHGKETKKQTKKPNKGADEWFPDAEIDSQKFHERINNMSHRFSNYARLSNKNFRKYSKQKHKQFADNGKEADQENDEMSERQMERFHNNEVNEENKNSLKEENNNDKKLKNNTNKDDKLTTEEKLKTRLYKTREKLNDAKNKEMNVERYKAISSQLKAIESEINDLKNADEEKKNKDEKIKEEKINKNDTKIEEQSSENQSEKSDDNKNGRFSDSVKDDSNSEKIDNNERFKSNKDGGEIAVNASLSENKEESSNKLNRFFDDVKNSQSNNNSMSNEPEQSKISEDNKSDKETNENYERKHNTENDLPDDGKKNQNSANSENGSEDKGKVKSAYHEERLKNNTNENDEDLYTRLDNSDKILSGIDIDSDKMHNYVNKVLQNSQFTKADDETRNEDELERLTSNSDKHLIQDKTKPRQKRSLKGKKKKKKKKNKKKVITLKPEKLKNDNGVKRQMFSPNRDESLARPKNLNYVILTVKSDLNSGDPFIIANVKFPKESKYQRACMEKIIADITTVNSEFDKRAAVLVMGDFHYDRLSGADNKGELYKMNTNLQIDGENYHSPIGYLERDPITTVYGRRFDNILTNINIKGNMRTIGPDFPLAPESVILPITLQRLYNNYITSLYTTDNDDSDKSYDCMKAYMMSGKKSLDTDICKTTWVPSSYISDHLPLQFNVKMNVPGKAAPIEIKLASWNIQGDTFKERLFDPVVRRGFLTALKKYHVAIFHEFPPHDRIIDDQELGSSDIVRLRQGQVTTEFGIYVSENVKDGETDMYVLRKKMRGDNNEVSEEEILSEPTVEEARNLITTVGLFAPKIVVDTIKIRPCFYTVKTSKTQTSGVDFSRIINAIDKDVQDRKCDFKVMLASLNLEENFDLDKEIYKSFKYINLKCLMSDGDNKFKYNIPRSRDLADYVIVLAHESDFEFGDCTIGLPGDEIKRGVDKLSDFEELTTHYPLSMVIKQSYNSN